MPLTWESLGGGDFRAPVPGGWLYRRDVMQGSKAVSVGLAFVPYEKLAIIVDGNKIMPIVKISGGNDLPFDSSHTR